MFGAGEAKLRYKRAIINFVAAYLIIEVLAALLSILVAALMHIDFSGNTADVHNQAFVVSERFYPLLNLAIWMVFAGIYFKTRTSTQNLHRTALKLGALWLVLALPLDFIFFVLIKTPYSLSPRDFYVGQIPWIYLVYLVLFFSPLLYVYLFLRRPLSSHDSRVDL